VPSHQICTIVSKYAGTNPGPAEGRNDRTYSQALKATIIATWQLSSAKGGTQAVAPRFIFVVLISLNIPCTASRAVPV